MLTSKRIVPALLIALLGIQVSSPARPPADPAKKKGRHAPNASIAGHFRTWVGEPSGVAGLPTYDRRELILSDAPFDDHGGNVDGLSGQELELFATGSSRCVQASPPGVFASIPETSLCSIPQGTRAATTFAGDYEYPSDLAPTRNAADIVEVRLAANAESIFLLVVLNALSDASRTAIHATIDDHEILAHGSMATLDGAVVDTAIDAATNTVEVRIPRTTLDAEASTHTLFVAAGIWSPADDDWYRPDDAAAPYFDLAYVSGEGFDTYWRDLRQSRDIASGEFSGDAVPIDFARLDGVACPAACVDVTPHGSGLTTRVFRSEQHAAGEGIVPLTRHATVPADSGLYLSRYQPYTLYDPFVEPAAPSPLVLLLHPFGGNHMSYALTAMAGIRRWANETGALIAMPFARGEGGWYQDEAEADVFEVWRDVARHYRIDEDRVYIAGVGMGGFGAYRLGLLYPDRFARAVVWGGMTTPARAADGYDVGTLMGNAANLPYLVVHGALDATTPIARQEESIKKLAEGGGQYRYVAYVATSDDTAYPETTIGHVLSWLDGLPRRATTPAHVRYTLRADVPGATQPASGAYWMDDVEIAPGRDAASVDAWRSIDPGVTTGTSNGSDVLGPYLVRWQAPRPPSVSNNYVSIDMKGASAVTVDASAIDWLSSEPGFVVAFTDVPAQLRLAGDFRATTYVEGVPFTIEDTTLVLHLPAGETVVRIGNSP